MYKTVLITGTSSGIGRAAVKRFAKNGWNVVATMRTPAKEMELAQLSEVLVTRLDVQDHHSIDEAIGAGLAHFGRIDALINNAGYGQYGLFEAVPREKIQKQFDVNLFGVMDVTQAILPHFRRNRAGLIINISSGAGLFTLPMASLYCASKFALEGFSEAVAYELASQNITVKLVEPHGGVSETAFNERGAADNATDPCLTDYDDFLRRTTKAYAQMSVARSINADGVAEVIYCAAVDGTDRFRYLVGNDTRGFVNARQEMSDQEYVRFMRSHFLRTI